MSKHTQPALALKCPIRVEELNDFCLTILEARHWMVELDFAGVYYMYRRVGLEWKLFRVTRSAALMVDTWNDKVGVDAQAPRIDPPQPQV